MKSNTEINEAVAKALGFKQDGDAWAYNWEGEIDKYGERYYRFYLPDFCNSLDACEKWIEPQCRWWERADDGEVTVRVNDSDNKFITAYQIGSSNEKPTAKAWCLAFLKAKGIGM